MKISEALLQALEAATMPASFFVQARQMQIPYYGAIARSIYNAGFIIGSATYDLTPLIGVSWICQ